MYIQLNVSYSFKFTVNYNQQSWFKVTLTDIKLVHVCFCALTCKAAYKEKYRFIR